MVLMVLIATTVILNVTPVHDKHIASALSDRLIALPSDHQEYSYDEEVDFTYVCQTGIREDNTDYIDCANRNLNSIPRFTTPTVCDVLNLSSNRLHVIPQDAFSNVRVSRLLLSNNPIRTIHPNAFTNLKQPLDELSISFDTRAVTDKTSNVLDLIKRDLINLSTLSISHLQLLDIPLDWIRSMKRLAHLELNDCGISDTANLKTAHNRLRHLSLVANNISSLQLSYLSTLEVLNLEGNQIETISRLSLPKQKLKVFSCSRNGLHTIT